MSLRIFTIAVLVAVAAGTVLPDFYVSMLNYVALYALVTLGVVLLTGVAGITSFGQAAFVGIGAYASAVVSVKFVSITGTALSGCSVSSPGAPRKITYPHTSTSGLGSHNRSMAPSRTLVVMLIGGPGAKTSTAVRHRRSVGALSAAAGPAPRTALTS